MKKIIIHFFFLLLVAVPEGFSQNNNKLSRTLNPGEQSIIAIAALTAKGDLPELKSDTSTMASMLVLPSVRCKG